MTSLRLVNNQPIERTDVWKPNLEVQNIFHTIQGEGPFAGRNAVFVRLAGCNLQCPGCDTDYTSSREEMTIRTIVERINELIPPNQRHAGGTCGMVLTGGEPFRQNFVPLLWEVRKGLPQIKFIQVETNGIIWVEEYHKGLLFDHELLDTFIVISPKTPRVHEEFTRGRVGFSWRTYWKYVLDSENVHPEDGLPTTVLGRPLGLDRTVRVARPDWNSVTMALTRHKIYVNPMDEGDEEKNRKNLLAAAHSCLSYGYTLGVQIHKLVGLP